MKRFLLTLCALLVAVPAFAEPVIVSETTNTPIVFVMLDDTGAVVSSPTITGVRYRKGTATTATAMTTPTTGPVTNETDTQYLVADEGTTITEGLAEENIEYYISASDAETVRVRCVIKAEQATQSELIAAILAEQLTLPTAGDPPASPTVAQALAYNYLMIRNPQKVDSGNNLITVLDDDGTTELFSYTTGDTAGVFTRGIATGPP